MAIEGYIPIQAPIVPNNDNPRMWTTEAKYVKGAPVLANTLVEFIAQHPNRLVKGNTGTIFNYPSAGVISEYRLISDPSVMVDSSGDTIVTEDNFTTFWELQTQIFSSSTRVYQYSADGSGGGAPTYPYTSETESNWSSVFDKNQGHRWMRFRDDDLDENEDDIFDNWTVPIPIGNIFTSGDYIENRFIRQDVSTSNHTSSGTLSTDKYYIVNVGRVQIDGDLSLNDIGQYGTSTQAILTIGRIFKYAAGNTYTFLDFAVVNETLKAPPRTLNGLPNNEPTGYEDTVPDSSTEQLWKISGQKSVYGQLKSDWIIEKVVEDPNYTRYSNSPSPHPDTIAGVNTDASDSTAGDTNLEAAGWNAVYSGQTFIARRSDDPGDDDYTNWLVEKISEESGEYVDRVFKLFNINLDSSSELIVSPTTRDPSDEGFSDTPLQETANQINYIFTARKFFNGELKTPWSVGVPYTGKDSFSDVIVSDLGDNFKYAAGGGSVTPTEITLQANLYKGLSKLWENSIVSIAYSWKKVYDGGSTVDVSPTDDSGDDFYKLAASGTPGTSGYLRADQRVVIKPDAVDGHAVFRCTQTLSFDAGDDVVFVEEYSILDITDGLDAKSLVLRTETQRVIWDTVGSAFSPTSVVIRAYQSNIPSPTYYWYIWNGSSWSSLTSDTDYTKSGNMLSFDPADIFASDGTGEQFTYAVSTHATNPDSADFSTTFSDYITITKLSSAGIGDAGENALAAILSNEAHVITLDSDTQAPISGEIGSSGRAITLLTLYDGQTAKVYGGGNDYTIAVTSDNANVTFDYVTNGDNVDIYVDSWTAEERNATCTITITYGSFTIIKKFSISTTIDAPGAIILDIDSNKGFVFTPDDKTDKTLIANLYDTSIEGNQLVSLPTSEYTFRWKVNNSWGSTSTSNFTKVIQLSDIATYSEVTVEVYLDAVLYRTRTIIMSDVNDGRSYRIWTDATSVSSSQKATTQNPESDFSSGLAISGVTWYLSTDTYWNTHTPVFAQDAQASGATWIWTNPYQLKGEKGDQGSNGGFFFPMYKASSTAPALGSGGSTASLAAMQAAGWTAKAPSSGIIWKTDRFWIGESVTFDANGNPSTGPISGSQWNPPIRISATDGTNGNNGNNGAPGPAIILAVVAGSVAGTKVQQVVGWIGTAPSPSYVGYYIGPTGFTNVLAEASVVTGDPVVLRVSGGYLQWKYSSESDVSYRNLIVIPASFQILFNTGHGALGDTEELTSEKTYETRTWLNNTGRTVWVRIEAMFTVNTVPGSIVNIRHYLDTNVDGTPTSDVWSDQYIKGDGRVPVSIIHFKSVASGSTLQFRSRGVKQGAGGNTWFTARVRYTASVIG